MVILTGILATEAIIEVTTLVIHLDLIPTLVDIITTGTDHNQVHMINILITSMTHLLYLQYLNFQAL